MRLFYEVMMRQIDEINEDFQVSEMIMILQELVIPDLELYTEYLEGIISIECIDQEQLEKSLKMRNIIKDNKSTYGL